jgi:hypothetical protein
VLWALLSVPLTEKLYYPASPERFVAILMSLEDGIEAHDGAVVGVPGDKIALIVYVNV